ncbi:hypothetical protein FP026_10545 [Rhizobium tropici]|uniref:Uncharacterized protein n=1 Tax=Rhizobium tropici TaxID=398 RepID=A0A5B0W795_RHITR|nr:hypothetical protein FP026_10545 [Rhizobium tropici]
MMGINRKILKSKHRLRHSPLCGGIALGYARAIPGKVRSGFPSGIARKQRNRAVHRVCEKLNRSSALSELRA